MPILLPFMTRLGDQQHITEAYVSVPPALTITDEAGAIWTLGFRATVGGEAPRGEFAFNVLVDGLDIGYMASRIERRQGRIRIFTAAGWKWMRTAPPQATLVYGIGAKLSAPSTAPMIVSVSVARALASAPALVSFAFESRLGGGYVSSENKPIECRPGAWLVARVNPVDVMVEVMASVRDGVLRSIPVQSIGEGAES